MSSFLDSLKNKKNEIDSRKASQTNLWKFPHGETQFQVIAADPQDVDSIAETIGMTWLRDPEAGPKSKPVAVVGDREICYGERDPIREGIIELVEKAKNEGDDTRMKFWQDSLAKARQVINIHVINASGEFKPNEATLADLPNSAYDQLIAAMTQQAQDELQAYLDDNEDTDPNAEKFAYNPLDPKKATIFTLTKEGSGMNTRYTVFAGRRAKPIPETALKSAVNLKDYVKGQFDDSVNKATNLIATYLGASPEEVGSLLSGAPEKETPALTHETVDDEIPFKEPRDDQGEVVDAEFSDAEVKSEPEKSVTDAKQSEPEEEEDIMAMIDAIGA